MAEKPDRYDHSAYRRETGRLIKRKRKAMGLLQKELAEMIGVTPRTIYLYEYQKSSISVENAANMSNVLDAPELMEIIRRHREKSCCICYKTFLDASSHWRKLTCSTRCLRTWKQRKQRLDTDVYRERGLMRTQGRLMVAEGRLREKDAAISAFCKACEPELVCRNGGCQLRSESPLPLATQRIA
jgi:transcriptional regulator with XRE-family HTH domain